ncbi:hypothetical protein RhiirA4_459652 [Rhizophagus irregularis]|uniref:Uncharacterized protein n=1 Tax=Rhizophagus irregularis TaxID=588596 RepID=A0A2I1GEV3_9GLOM|nr:hypothetical protein RhiirA4_459652 [Rhizophagus irregularis]
MIFWKHYGHYFELFLRLDGLTGHAVIGNAGQDEGLTSNEKGKRKGFFLMEGNPSVPKWILDFTSGDITNAGDPTKDDPQFNFIDYVTGQLQNGDNLFKSFIIAEFVRGESIAKKFNIKCRYIKAKCNDIRRNDFPS